MSSDLQDYVKRNSKTFSLKDGEFAEVTYRGYKIGANKFDPEKESVYYQFETEYGVKTFQSGALSLANLFDTIEKDTEIRITREGEGNKTKYFVEKKIDGQFVAADTVEEE